MSAITADITETASFHSPLGWIKIVINQDVVTQCCFTGEQEPGKSPASPAGLLRDVSQQFTEYFAGKRKSFNLPYTTEGTSFQRKIWQLVQEIPYGETISYQELAIKSGSAANSRAVGQANGRNPLALIIPCHRVIAKNQSLQGYAWGLNRKKWLLEFEGAFPASRQLSFFTSSWNSRIY